MFSQVLIGKGRALASEAEAFSIHALEGEVPLACVQAGMSTYILTDRRLCKFGVSGGLKESYPLSEIEAHRFVEKYDQLSFFFTPRGFKEQKVGAVFDVAKEFQAVFEEAISADFADDSLRIESSNASAERWSKVRTNRKKANFPKHLVKAISRNAKTGEDPLMIISGEYDSTEGSLIVFEDRCVISKSGVVGGLLAGSLGGGRDATFYFTDITGIEYNSGMMMGVLEILTASYQGTATRDYWSGITNPARNLSENDPRVLSNTLPLPKSDYQSAKPLIDELKTMIRDSKETKVTVTGPTQAVPSQVSVADEITKLAALLESGVISEEEFKKLKDSLL